VSTTLNLLLDIAIYPLNHLSERGTSNNLTLNQDCFGFGCRRQQKRHAAAPPSAGVRRRMERNRQKLVGRDKGSLTEQQTKGTGTTMKQKKGVTQNKPAEQSPQNRTALSERTAAEPSQAMSAFLPRTPPKPA